MRRNLLIVRTFAAAAAAALALWQPPAVAAEAFPPITAAEKALTAIPGQGNAPAVVLFRAAQIEMKDPKSDAASSRFKLRVRMKVLTEAGKDLGTVSVFHASQFRLHGLEARTVLPDGRVIPVEGSFRATMSKSERTYVTSIAFPAVEVGAILDYQYEAAWDNSFYLEPYLFQDRFPVLHAEASFLVPFDVGASLWTSDPAGVGLKREQQATAQGTRVKVWADNLPAILDEPFSPPFGNLAARAMMVPKEIFFPGQREPLLKDWASACELIDRGDYRRVRAGRDVAERKAREIAKASASGTRAKAVAIYSFVRDEIATEPFPGVFTDGTPLGDVLARRRGTPAEKALLLQVMLDAVRIESRLVWAASHDDGEIDTAVANPTWFGRVLVAAEIDGRRTWLDPSDPALAFGHLAPGYEGSPAVLVDRKHPEVVTLPATPFADNLERATLDLHLDPHGRASGQGTLLLTGALAWGRTRRQASAAAANEYWEKWLRKELPEFEVRDVVRREASDEPRIEVSWAMEQRGDDAPGDEASFAPSRPLGPVVQPFPAGAKRHNPVAFESGERIEVELKLHWSDGWKLDAAPRDVSYESPAGAVVVSTAVEEGQRGLIYRRRFDRAVRDARSRDQFDKLQQLYTTVQKSDAQTLVLARH